MKSGYEFYVNKNQIEIACLFKIIFWCSTFVHRCSCAYEISSNISFDMQRKKRPEMNEFHIYVALKVNYCTCHFLSLFEIETTGYYYFCSCYWCHLRRTDHSVQFHSFYNISYVWTWCHSNFRNDMMLLFEMTILNIIIEKYNQPNYN